MAQNKRYLIKLDARNLPEKKTHIFTDMFLSDDAKRYTLNKSKTGLQVIGELKLFNLLEYELTYNRKLNQNVKISLVIQDLESGVLHPLDEFTNISITDTDTYDAFLRQIRL